jgi:hypothetical protein
MRSDAPVHSPYTINFADSFFAAEACAGLMITALLLFWQSRSWLAFASALCGVWIAVVANAVAPFERAVGYDPGPETLAHILAASAACGTLAALLARRRFVAAFAAIGQVLLWLACHYVKDSDAELAALHLAWLGLVVGLLLRTRPAPAGDAVGSGAEPDYQVHDWALFAGATAVSAIVCLAIMRGREGTADEWAYTFQAAVFAKGRAYAAVPPCQPYLRNFYVFEYAGRLFASYTPGWPLFIVPFIWFRAPWLSGPFAMGLLAVGVARLARSASRASGPVQAQAPSWPLSSPGTWSGLLIATGVMMTINAGSRYPHIYAMALYAWSLEAFMMVSLPGRSVRSRWVWGIVLGAASATLLATRPAEGATMGVGIAAAFVATLIRGRLTWQAVAGAGAAFAGCGLFSLVILRLQLGTWFTTGYSLNAIVYPWNVTKYDMPKPDEWKYGLPFATSAYCWWPCCLPLGLAGLASLRGRSIKLLVALAAGAFFYVFYFEWLDTGQRGVGVDWGYGPRYLMLLAVPIAVGGGLAIAPLAAAAQRRSLEGRSAMAVGGPMALVLFAIACGWARITPLVWPTVFEHTRRHGGLTTAIAQMQLKNAVVLAKPGTTGFDVLDITTNLPVDLYPHQDAIIAVDKAADTLACMKRAFPDRKFFSASGADPVRIAPY